MILENFKWFSEKNQPKSSKDVVGGGWTPMELPPSELHVLIQLNTESLQISGSSLLECQLDDTKLWTSNLLEDLLDVVCGRWDSTWLPLDFHNLRVKGWVLPWFQRDKPNACLSWRVHKNNIVFNTWRCRFCGNFCPGTCIITDILSSIVVWMFLTFSDLKKVAQNPYPSHVFGALIWKYCSLELRKSFRSLLTMLRKPRNSSLVSSRFFLWWDLLCWLCSYLDESFQRQLIWLHSVTQSFSCNTLSISQ